MNAKLHQVAFAREGGNDLFKDTRNSRKTVFKSEAHHGAHCVRCKQDEPLSTGRVEMEQPVGSKEFIGVGSGVNSKARNSEEAVLAL